MLNIDKYAYSSKLKNQNPMEKFIFAILAIGVCLWADYIPTSIVIVLTMAWVTIKKGGTPSRLFIKLMLLPISFLIIGVLTIAFGTAKSPQSFIMSMHIFGIYIGASKSGIIAAARLFFKSLGAVSCLYYLSLNTPMVDILSTFKRLRCPKLLIEIMRLIYRFIFVLLETADSIYTAQKSRLGYARLSTGYHSMGALMSTLFIRAYKQSDELYTAMEVRGYNGEIGVLEEPFQSSYKSYLPLLLINILFIAVTIILKRLTGGNIK